MKTTWAVGRWEVHNQAATMCKTRNWGATKGSSWTENINNILKDMTDEAKAKLEVTIARLWIKHNKSSLDKMLH